MRKILIICFSLWLASCASTHKPIAKPVNIKKPLIKKSPVKNAVVIKFNNHFDFVAQAKYPKTYDVYEDDKLMVVANPDNTTIEINTSTQRLLLLVNGQVAFDAPSTTGSKKKKDVNDGIVVNKSTPHGSFKVIQKLEEKKSNIYGDFYYNGRKVYTGDVRKYKEPYDQFIGVGMPYWMRFYKAMGMHQSDAVTRYPGSNGCVRLSMKTVKKIFEVVKVGTQVDVIEDINLLNI